MVTIDYVIKQADKFKRTNTATLYRRGNDVFKIIDPTCLLYNEIIKNILLNYAIHSKVNPHIILPTDLIADNEGITQGYKCRYVPGKNLEDHAQELSTEEKIALLNQLTELLKEINNYLIVGDVNLANCMYDCEGNGYLIDFDLSVQPGEEPPKVALYNFRKKKDKKPIRSNLSTDKLKMAIICASVLYDTDFEYSFILPNNYNKWNKFYQYTNNWVLKDFFKESFKRLNHGEQISDYLFLPNSSSFVDLVNQDKELVRKRY